MSVSPLITNAQSTSPATSLYSVGMRNIEYKQGDREMVMSIFYPAQTPKSDQKPLEVPLTKGLEFYKNAPIQTTGKPYPLIMFSHGRDGDRFNLAWLAQYLAARGYIVAAVDHYAANSYTYTYEYGLSKLWQRPRDIINNLTYLLEDKEWSQYIDPNKIGVAGHSQGGFTALWVGGVGVNPTLFNRYQELQTLNPVLPEYYKANLMNSSEDEIKASDPRIKAAFTMAPARIKMIGMDENGLKQMKIPTYIMAAGGDSIAPFEDNAKFASKYIPNVKLTVVPGEAGHEIFVNECNDHGKAFMASACVDADNIDRAKVHEFVAKEAVNFFDTALNYKSKT